jgi:hypothetical protein
MNSEKLTEENFLLFCAHHYDNSRYTSTEEFLDDINRIKYIKKLITRYIENGDLKERLLLNHIIVLNNCFGPEILCKILYLKLKPQMKYIKPFLIFINALPEKIYNIDDEDIIDTNFIEMDLEIINKLRKV